MFTIIGGDGKEYGPVSAEEVRTWLASGRATLSTKAKASGTGEWRALGDFAEFGAPPSLIPPPLGAASAPPASPPSVAFPADFELADRGSRLLARLIDWVLSMVAYAPGFVLMGPFLWRAAMSAQRGQRVDFDGVNTSGVILGGLLMCVLTLGLWITQIVMLSTRGQTIGKRIMSIRIVRFPDNAAAGFVNAWFLRSFVVHVAAFFLNLVFWLGTLFLITDTCFIFRDDQRCIHDLIASTRVIKARKP